MKHTKMKEILLDDPELRKEYDALEPLYEMKSELIRLRLEKGLSQKELAALLGTKQSAISRLEGGNSNPSIEFIIKVAQALDKKVHISFT